jgi:hypothetical protein
MFLKLARQSFPSSHRFMFAIIATQITKVNTFLTEKNCFSWLPLNPAMLSTAMITQHIALSDNKV